MRDPSSAAAAAAGAETPEKRCSTRASPSALTRSAADRWLKAAPRLRLSPHGEENGRSRRGFPVSLSAPHAD